MLTDEKVLSKSLVHLHSHPDCFTILLRHYGELSQLDLGALRDIGGRDLTERLWPCRQYNARRVAWGACDVSV